VTRTEFATLIATTPDRVSKHIAEGLPVVQTGNGRGNKTIIDLAKALPWLLKRSGGSLDTAKTRLAIAQAERNELDNQVRREKVLPIDDVERIWSAEVAAVRGIILASYTTHADRVHRASTLEGLAGVERTLKDLAYEVLRELANPERAPMPAASGAARQHIHDHRG